MKVRPRWMFVATGVAVIITMVLGTARAIPHVDGLLSDGDPLSSETQASSIQPQGASDSDTLEAAATADTYELKFSLRADDTNTDTTREEVWLDGASLGFVETDGTADWLDFSLDVTSIVEANGLSHLYTMEWQWESGADTGHVRNVRIKNTTTGDQWHDQYYPSFFITDPNDPTLTAIDGAGTGSPPSQRNWEADDSHFYRNDLTLQRDTNAHYIPIGTTLPDFEWPWWVHVELRPADGNDTSAALRVDESTLGSVGVSGTDWTEIIARESGDLLDPPCPVTVSWQHGGGTDEAEFRRVRVTSGDNTVWVDPIAPVHRDQYYPDQDDVVVAKDDSPGNAHQRDKNGVFYDSGAFNEHHIGCDGPPSPPDSLKLQSNVRLGTRGHHARNPTVTRSDPVNTAIGNFTHESVDLTLPEPGDDFEFIRTYNSADDLVGPLGRGWTHSYDVELTLQRDGFYLIDEALVRGEDGQRVFYDADGSGYAGEAGALSTLADNGSGGFTLTRHDQVTYEFDSDGKLVEIQDPNGNTTFLQRDAQGEVTAIEDPLGRIIDLVYDADGHLTRVKTPDGRDVTFTYDTKGRLDTATDPRGSTTEYRYDGMDRLTEIIDANGHSIIRNTYGSEGRVIEQTDPLGNVSTFTWNTTTEVSVVTDAAGNTWTDDYDNGVLVSETDPNGNTTTHEHDAALNRTATIDPASGRTEMTYDTAGNLTSQTDPLGNTTTHVYDSGNRVTSVTDPLSNTTTYAYDTAGNRTSQTDPLGNTTTYTYDAAGNRLTETDANGGTTDFEYDSAGNLTADVSAGGHRTTHEYDTAGNRTATVDPRGHEPGATVADFRWTFGYDDNRNLTSRTDPNGNATTFAYDPVGNLVSETDPLGNTTAWTYNAANEITTVTDPEGNTTTFTYDAVGNNTTVTDAEGDTTTMTYDGVRNLEIVTTPLGHTTSYAYDANNQLDTTTTPRGNEAGATPSDFTWAYDYDTAGKLTGVTDPHGNTTAFGYDAASRRTSHTDANGNTTTLTYDAASQLTKLTAADGTDTTYRYDAVGNRTSRTDANGHTTSWSYDAGNLLTARTTPSGNTTTFTYDAAGHPDTETSPAGNTTADPDDGITDFTYDELSRLTRIEYSDGPTYSHDLLGVDLEGSEATPSVQFGYDAAGRRTSMRDGAGEEHYTYDKAGRLLSIERGTDVIEYTYDANGRVASRTYPEGTTIDYTYDDDGRVTEITGPEGTATQTHDPAGRLVTRTHANASVETYDYDRVGRLDQVSVASSGSPVTGFQYTYDPAGNTTSVTTPTGTETYSYDTLNRLTEVCYSACSSDSIEWTYDPVGNRLTETRPAITTTYSYDADDQLLNETTGSEVTESGYDPNGNMIRRGEERYAYDAADRLAVHIKDQTAHHYAYDGDGKRLQRQTRPLSGTTTSETHYTWDPNFPLPQLVAERHLPEGTTTTYTQGDGLVAMTEDGLTGSESFAVHPDRLGSVSALTNAAGSPVGQRSYEPFGVTRNDSIRPDVSFGFTGEYLDDPTGLYHLRARDYLPQTGRFTTPDPLEALTTQPYTSTYAYADNQPTTKTDPSGMRANARHPRQSELLRAEPISHVAEPPDPFSAECRSLVGASAVIGLISAFLAGLSSTLVGILISTLIFGLLTAYLAFVSHQTGCLELPF